MAKIELGGFGTSVQDIAPAARTEVVGEAVQQLGGQVGQIAQDLAQKRFQQQAAIASSNLTAYQVKHEANIQSLQERLASGEVSPEQAADEYKKLQSGNVLPRVDHLTPDAASAYQQGATRLDLEGELKVQALADVARKYRAQDQAGQGIDNSLKLGGAAGMTPEKKQQIEQQIRGYGPVLRANGVPQDQADKRVQDAVDQLWLDDAQQRAIQNHDNVAGLKQLQKDLTDGFYTKGAAPKLDTNKRNALMGQVDNRIDVIRNHLELQAAKRETDGYRALNEYDTQIATGVVAPQGKMAEWAQRTQGTPAAKDFADALQQEREVQRVLQMPAKDQVDYYRTLQAQQTNQGATVRDQQHLEHLRLAINRNVDLMTQAPLEWLDQRSGESFAPLNFSALLAQGGPEALSAQINQRVLSLQAAQQKDPAIQMRPLMRQEADQLGALAERITPDQVASTFGALRQIAGSTDAYVGMMAQIAPDHPVLALAGRRALQDPKVAEYMIAGERLLNPTKQDKANDGKPKAGLYAPSDAALQQAFATAVGTTYRGREAVAETDFQAFKAYYVGKAEHDGVLLEKSGVPDTKLLNQATTAIVGTVINYNGQGDVQAPWGMDRGTFSQRLDNAWRVAAQKYPGLAEMTGPQRTQIGLINADKEGQYWVPVNGHYLHAVPAPGKAPELVVLDVTSPEAINYVAPTRALVDPRTGATVSQ